MGLGDVLREIERLGQSRRLVPAEQVIMTAILQLEPFLVPGLTEEELTEVQGKLLQLYNANQSEFSIQCSIFIASKLLVTYQLSKNPQVWDLFNLAIAKNCTSVIMAAGYVCRHIGDRFKAQLPRLAEHLLKQKSNIEYATAFCLRGMYKSGGSVLIPYIPQVIEFCRKALLLTKQATTVAVIKLLKALVKFNETNVSHVLDCVRLLIRDDQIPFIKNELSMLFARIAFAPMASVTEQTESKENEWVLGKSPDEEHSEMDKALSVIDMFPSLVNMTFPHFLNLLSPVHYEHSHGALYKFVREKCESLMPELVPMLPADVRYTYFKDLGKESVSGAQLRLLTSLCPDNELIFEAAGVAMLLVCADDKESRDSALEFFTSFSKAYPSATLSYLRSALAFLSSPAAYDGKVSEKIRGNAALVYTILSNVPSMEDALAPNEELLRDILNSALSQSNPDVAMFASAFSIMSVLPERFIEKSTVQNALKKGMEMLKKLSSSVEIAELLNAMFSFQAKHLFADDLSALISFSLSHSSRLSLSSIAAISEICTLSGSISADLVKLILFSAYSVSPTGETLKVFITRTLPTGFDLLKISKPVSLTKRQEQDALMRIVNAFPALLNALLDADRQQIYDILMRGQIVNSTGHLILLSICRSPFPMPKDTLAVLLKLLETNNISQLEIISESVSYFCVKNPVLLNTVFAVVEKKMSMSSCILLSSLFTHVRVPQSLLSRAMVFLSSSVNNGALVPFAMHAFSSALLTHSIQMSSLGATRSQMSVLFQILQTTVSIQPVALRLCSECFTLLIEDLSGDLAANTGSLPTLVNLVLRTIEMTPISYAREIYFECSGAILTFCNSLGKIAPIKFPLYAGAPAALQIVACETFTKALHFQNLYLPISQLTNPLLTLLQRTGNQHVANFLTALATTSGDDSVSFWVGTLRRILSGNSLFVENPIEPVAAVKVCCLSIAKAVLPKLAERMILKAENLDDIISSASHSTETNRLELQEAAFPVLKLVIDLFSEKKSDTGGWLLDLYESQFAQAVQTGFKLSLTISGGFLSNYLVFLTSKAENAENLSIIHDYMDGLLQCKQRTPPYYALATHLCRIARTRKDGEISKFIIDVAPAFEEIAFEAMKLWKNRSDWRSLAHFRDFAVQFYGDLLSSLVWIQSISKSDVSVEAYVAFLVSEILFGNEDWMLDAAYNAIPVALEQLGNKIPIQLIELILRLNYDKHKDIFLSIINACSRILDKTSDYDKIREFLLSIALESQKPMPSVMASVILTDENACLHKYYPTLVKWVIDKHVSRHVDEKSSVALLSLLFNNDPNIIGFSCELILEVAGTHPDFVLNCLQVALPRARDNIPLVSISRFCIAMFKKGGMVLIGHLLLENPDLGLALLSQGSAKAAFLLCANDITNARAYLRFIQLALTTAEKSCVAENFGLSVLKLVLHLISSFGGDVQIGHQIISLCVSLLFDVRRVLGEAKFENEYDALSESEKEGVVSLLKTQIARSALRERNANLVAFSSGVRSRREEGDDEWGELEIGD